MIFQFKATFVRKSQPCLITRGKIPASWIVSSLYRMKHPHETSECLKVTSSLPGWMIVQVPIVDASPGYRIPSAFWIFWGGGRVMEDLLAVRTSFGHRFLGPGPELWRHLWKMDPNTVNPLRSHTHTHSSQIAHCGNICI